MENIVVALFKEESKAYQGLSRLKKDCVNSSYTISQIALIKKENGHILADDGFDTGVKTQDDTLMGGLFGSLIGVLGGPIGVLLGGSIGLLIGSNIDSNDALEGGSMLEYVSQNLVDGEVALIALVQETDETLLDTVLQPYDVSIIRYNAAEIAEEVESVLEIQKEMERKVKEKLREEKSEKRKLALKEKSDKLKAEFETFRKKFNND